MLNILRKSLGVLTVQEPVKLKLASKDNDFDTDKTLIIFGRSPFINDIKDFIPDLIAKYDTLGINSFCVTYPDVKAVAFFDDCPPKISPDNLVITNIRNACNSQKKTYWALKNHKYQELYSINRRGDKLSSDQSFLNFYIHTPSMAINWAVLKGYTNIILAGVDLQNKTGHFDAPDFLLDLSDDNIAKAKNHLEKICTKYINIYQLNPDSSLDLPKVKIEELL